MPLDPKRKGDIKVIVGASVAVILVGLFIFAAAMVTTRGGPGIQCGQLNIGLATDVRNNLNDGPYFQTGGGRCGFWLALANGNIVAYKAVQPSGCTAQLKLDHWDCDGKPIAAAKLAQYPVSITSVTGEDAVIVNLGTPAPTTTTTVRSATTGAQCGRIDIGLATDIRTNLTNGPYFQTGGGHCGFWLALANGDIVAYKAVQPSGCTVQLEVDQWKCDGAPVAAARLAQYPLSITSVTGEDAVIVNLGTPAPTTTTAATTTT